MTAPRVMLWAATGGLSIGALAWSSSRFLESRSAARAGLAALHVATQNAEELDRLRAAAPPWAAAPRPAPGLATRVTAALAAAGLPASSLALLSPEAETAVGGADAGLRAMRSRAVVTLSPLTLPQLGGFLSAWAEREPRWTVSSIEVAPVSGGPAPAPASDLPLRAVVGIETLFVEAPAAPGGAR